jgi:hypothetical protein
MYIAQTAWVSQAAEEVRAKLGEHMKQRQLGSMKVSALGMGCMGLSFVLAPPETSSTEST